MVPDGERGGDGAETSVSIARLGHLGDGIGTDAAGRTLYVARALPGETVAGIARGDRLERGRILAPSDARVRAPCPHYGGCGGCALQHARDGFVADWKQDVVRRALAAQGLDAPLRPLVTSPPARRRRAGFALRRGKGGVTVGFHAPMSDSVTDTPDCRLVLPALLAARPYLQGLGRAGASRKAALTAQVTALDNGLDVAVSGAKPLDPAAAAGLAGEGEAHGVVRLTWNGETVAQAARPVLRVGGIDVTPPPGAFLQATEAGEAALRDAVTEALGDAGHVADLFAGLGTFALPLARRAQVHAVEGDAAHCAALAEGWRRAGGLRPLTAETRDLFRRPLDAGELARFDGVVIDPPRAGAEAQMRALAASRVPRIAAVSCNPVTFARDARALVAGGYRLAWVQVVDQFRWSPHVELAALFAREHPTRKA